VTLATKLVFAGWRPSATAAPASASAADFAILAKMDNAPQLFGWLTRETNDLEAPAIALAPVIVEVLASLRATAGCRLARMSGSGATCLALFSSAAETAAAARNLRVQFPHWWISETMLG
jgi:4-diphosphocytidyl-2-C-methyl-D-erythritol kinase